MNNDRPLPSAPLSGTSHHPGALPARLVDWFAHAVQARLEAAEADDGRDPVALATADAAAALPAGWPAPDHLCGALAAVDQVEAATLLDLLQRGTLDQRALRCAHAVFAGARCALVQRSQAPQPDTRQNLQQALAARDRQLSIATHELRTPISSILLNLQLLERAAQTQGTLNGATVTRLLAVPARQLRRLMRMVDLLLDAAQVESERLVLHRQPLDLCRVVHDAVARLQQLADGAACTIDLAGCQPVPGRWDRLRLEQVVTNLLTNAIKYGGGRVEVRTWGEGDRAFIEVADHGEGIAAEDHVRIFEPYLRLPSTVSEDGAGLGLYIVREIVLAHGGRIRVASPPGAGAVFEVELPV